MNALFSIDALCRRHCYSREDRPHEDLSSVYKKRSLLACDKRC